ncbi:MAG: hypothetical protein RJB26_2431 [Pseudomonadota bacterium]|jgi:hypothetical protein
MNYEDLKEAIDFFGDGAHCNKATRLLMQAARAHLETLPRTKWIDAWYVEYATDVTTCWHASVTAHKTRELAETWADQLRKNSENFACVRITGPHKHMVPA